MGKGNRNYDKEWTRGQKYKKENEKLKRENAQLRKIIDRLDLSQHKYIRDAIASKEKLDKTEEKNTRTEEQAWQCWDCGKGVLRLKIFEIREGFSKYYRKCDCCPKRTKAKTLNSNVKGPK